MDQEQLIAYASRTGTKKNLHALREAQWRILVSATGVLRCEGFQYALDNGAWHAYCQGKLFDEKLFIKALRKMGRNADWVVLPDIVTGGKKSLDLSLKWMRIVLDETNMCLIAVQDGMNTDDLSCSIGNRVGIFVGGSTSWKLSTMPLWGLLSKKIGCWMHVGRVNSAKRILLCSLAGANSFDGTSVTRYSKNIHTLDLARKQMVLFNGF